MALDINGYNNAFRGFVQFAEGFSGLWERGVAVKATQVDARYDLSVASARSSSWLSRKSVDERENDYARELFRKAVIEMFGGSINKVPKSVKKAMRLCDYNCGKPLTARRILAVKAAIDKEGSAHQIALGRFWANGVKKEALKLGFTKAELPKLARATHFYAQAKGIDEMKAMREVAQYGTKANRLAFYGGRFLENVENFKAGMKLLDSFSAWYGEQNSFVIDNNKGKHFADAKTLTHLNIAFKIASNADGQRGLEAFIFQDIAADKKFDLKKRGEDAFGFANNPAMRYFGRNCQNSIFGTIFNVPPEKRRILFAANDALTPMISDSKTASLFENNKKAKQIIGNGVFAARVLNNLPALEAIIAKKGKLTAKDVFKTCFPGINVHTMLQTMTAERVKEMDDAVAKLNAKKANPQQAQTCEERIRKYEAMKKAELASAAAAKDDDLYSLAILNYWYDDYLRVKITSELEKFGIVDQKTTGTAIASIKESMVSSGCTVDEAIDAFCNGKTLQIGSYQTGYSMELDTFPSKGLSQMKLDLTRGTNYTNPATNEDYLTPEEQKFGFTFPDGPAFTCSTAADAEMVEEKIRQLCGEGHTLQAEIVGANLSQGAAVPIKGSLASFDIQNNEHAVLNYSLTKDSESGAIKIKYSSPASLPVSFSWTCTVSVDGNCTTTPLELKEKGIIA